MLRGGETGKHENPGADDAADAEGDQRRNAQGAFQALVGRFLLVSGDRLGCEHPLDIHVLHPIWLMLIVLLAGWPPTGAFPEAISFDCSGFPVPHPSILAKAVARQASAVRPRACPAAASVS